MINKIKIINEIIDYIENHLYENLSIDDISKVMNYSKYHLHRLFSNIVGVTIHDYINRRRLTESAEFLVFTDKSIIEIALNSGYESQQAFSNAFKDMYKISPKKFRERKSFYPLQLRFFIGKDFINLKYEIFTPEDIDIVSKDDIEKCMDLVKLVVDGFPGFEQAQYMESLIEHIQNKEAFIIKYNDNAIAVMFYSIQKGNIDFLAVHPKYNKREILITFISKIFNDLSSNREMISITTFREGDKADRGYRELLLTLGFIESDLLTEFGYPTQKMILKRKGFEELL